MSNPTPVTGDDLIIIADENHNDTSTVTLDSSNPLADVLNIDTQTQTNSNPNEVAPAPEITFDLGTDITAGDIGEVNAIDNTLEDSVESESNESTLSLDIDTPSISPEQNEVSASTEIPQTTIDVESSTVSNDSILETDTIDTQETSDTIVGEDDMDGILTGTIAKLQRRQATIHEIKESKEKQINTLNEEISQLKDQVSNLHTDVSALDTEDAKIQANVSALENMKSTPSELAEVDLKQHNQNRVQKSKKAA